MRIHKIEENGVPNIQTFERTGSLARFTIEYLVSPFLFSVFPCIEC